jgi:hypothetical protein
VNAFAGVSVAFANSRPAMVTAMIWSEQRARWRNPQVRVVAI